MDLSWAEPLVEFIIVLTIHIRLRAYCGASKVFGIKTLVIKNGKRKWNILCLIFYLSTGSSNNCEHEIWRLSWAWLMGQVRVRGSLLEITLFLAGPLVPYSLFFVALVLPQLLCLLLDTAVSLGLLITFRGDSNWHYSFCFSQNLWILHPLYLVLVLHLFLYTFIIPGFGIFLSVSFILAVKFFVVVSRVRMVEWTMD